MKHKVFLLLIIFLIISGGVVFFKSAKPAKKILRVMVYSSFVNVFGPGPLIKTEFEKICDCQIKWLKVSDSTLFAQRLSLKKDGFKTDVVLGLDQLSLKKARALPWKEVTTSDRAFLPPADRFLSPYFVPYNWSPMSFLSRKQLNQPDFKKGTPFTTSPSYNSEPKPESLNKRSIEQALSLKDLLNKKFQHNISLPSYRTSTVGLQFYYWIWSVFQEQTKHFLKAFQDQLYGLSPSWSTSYALFQRGHVDLSFSYLSSLLYHRHQQQKDFYFVFFEEGHPFQVEMAGVSGFCTQCTLAKSFVLFLLKPDIQNILKTKNYMLPVTIPSDKDFPALQDIKLISYETLPVFLAQKEKGDIY